MRRTVFAKTVDDHRRSLIGWIIGIAFLVAFTVAFWPSMESSTAQFTDMIEQMPEALRAMMGTTDIASPSGFLSSQLFAFMLPVMIGVLGIGKGAGTLAGEEERGEVELLLARPLPRWRIAAEKAAGVLLSVTVVTAAAFVATWAGAAAVDMGVPTPDLAGAMLGLGLLGWVFAASAFAAGAATGRRATAITVGTLVAVSCYLATTFGPLVDALTWAYDASPWTWAFGRDAIAEGPTATSAAGLVLVTVVTLTVGVQRFTARDIGV